MKLYELDFVAQTEHNPNYSRPTFIHEINNVIQNSRLSYIFTQKQGLKFTLGCVLSNV